MIVDTHLHYWRWPEEAEARAAAQSVARGASAPVEEDLGYDEVAATMGEAGVAHAVQVTRVLSGYDNSYSLEGARARPGTFRVCARFDARGPDVGRRLGELMEDELVVAVRLFWYPPDQVWLEDGSVDGFWRAAEERGLAVCVYAPQNVGALVDVAARFEGLRLVIDHLGVDLFSPPGQRFHQWDDVRRLAKFDNVSAKVSALPEAAAERFPFRAAQERVREAFDWFGPDRLMWGSNWPLTARACTYAEAVDLIRVGCSFLSDEGRARLLGGTARRTFGLP